MNCFMFVASEPERSEQSGAVEAKALNKGELLHLYSAGTGVVGTKWSHGDKKVYSWCVITHPT